MEAKDDYNEAADENKGHQLSAKTEYINYT